MCLVFGCSHDTEKRNKTKHKTSVSQNSDSLVISGIWLWCNIILSRFFEREDVAVSRKVQQSCCRLHTLERERGGCYKVQLHTSLSSRRDGNDLELPISLQQISTTLQTGFVLTHCIFLLGLRINRIFPVLKESCKGQVGDTPRLKATHIPNTLIFHIWWTFWCTIFWIGLRRLKKLWV